MSELRGCAEIGRQLHPLKASLYGGKKALSSVCPSVHWSLRLSVHLSICPTYFQKKEGKNCQQISLKTDVRCVPAALLEGPSVRLTMLF